MRIPQQLLDDMRNLGYDMEQVKKSLKSPEADNNPHTEALESVLKAGEELLHLAMMLGHDFNNHEDK